MGYNFILWLSGEGYCVASKESHAYAKHVWLSVHMGSISLWISFASIFFAHKKRTTPRCSIVVHVFRGAAIL
jgi:hypothetical protein